jgi:septal ring factor EnvC (AmiA/AmiB activator)
VLVDSDGRLATFTVNASDPSGFSPKGVQPQAMLNRNVDKLQATVAQQKKQIEILTAQLKEQAAQIQNVSAQLEASKPAPQVVKNNQ